MISRNFCAHPQCVKKGQILKWRTKNCIRARDHAIGSVPANVCGVSRLCWVECVFCSAPKANTNFNVFSFPFSHPEFVVKCELCSCNERKNFIFASLIIGQFSVSRFSFACDVFPPFSVRCTIQLEMRINHLTKIATFDREALGNCKDLLVQCRGFRGHRRWQVSWVHNAIDTFRT